jgi:hypothetical protein
MQEVVITLAVDAGVERLLPSLSNMTLPLGSSMTSTPTREWRRSALPSQLLQALAQSISCAGFASVVDVDERSRDDRARSDSAIFFIGISRGSAIAVDLILKLNLDFFLDLGFGFSKILSCGPTTIDWH